MKATLFGLLSLVAVTVPAGVRAENCTATYRSAFSQLNPSSGPSQASADAEVERLFGPRPMKCEEGAYKNFLELFEAFARESIRSGQPTKRGKVTVPPSPAAESGLRLAIAAFRKSPIKVPGKEAKDAVSSYRQIRSNLNAVVDDAGSTPTMNQLMEAIAVVKAPIGEEDAAPTSTPTTVSPTSAPTPPVATTQAIRIPVTPLPSWAVIKIYEARDAVKSQDIAAIQVRLQDIINWMESSTLGQQ